PAAEAADLGRRTGPRGGGLQQPGLDRRAARRAGRIAGQAAAGGAARGHRGWQHLKRTNASINEWRAGMHGMRDSLKIVAITAGCLSLLAGEPAFGQVLQADAA